jgi:DNA-binding transcriptional ArsR family regulator
MVNYSPAALDATFAALADPTRRAILARLARGESSVTCLARPFRMSLPAVSKHLRVLERARLLQREKVGRVHRCRLSPGPLKQAAEWIRFYQLFWQDQFDALAEFLENSTGKETSWKHSQKHPNLSSKSGERLPRRRKASSRPGRNPRR